MKRAIRHVFIIRITMVVTGKLLDIFPDDLWSQTDHLRMFVRTVQVHYLSGFYGWFGPPVLWLVYIRSNWVSCDKTESGGTNNGDYEKKCLTPVSVTVAYPCLFYALICGIAVAPRTPPVHAILVRGVACFSTVAIPVRQRKLLVPLMNRRPFCLQVANFEK